MPVTPRAKRVSVEDAPFVILSFMDSPQVPQVARYVHRVVAAYSDGRFAHAPSAPVFILLFFDHDAFLRWSDDHYGPLGQGNLGSYQKDEREMAVDVSKGEKSWRTIAHELVHTFTADEDWNRAGQHEGHIPVWFDECFASVFESDRWVGDAIHGEKWSRRWELLKKIAGLDRATAPDARVDRLFGMSDDEFRGIDPAVGVVATPARPGAHEGGDAAASPELFGRALRLPLAGRSGRAGAVQAGVSRELRVRPQRTNGLRDDRPPVPFRHPERVGSLGADAQRQSPSVMRQNTRQRHRLD